MSPRRVWRILIVCMRRGSRSPWAIPILILVSFTESSCFILPPEFMLIPMTIFQKKRGVVFALTTIIASVFGAMFGYALGRFLWDIISPYFFNYIPGFSRYFDTVGQFYKQNAFAYLMIAGFTPIPYKVFTVVAGVYHELISLSMVVTTAIISRGIRYSLFVFLLSYFSQKRAILIVKKYFGPITIVITLLAIAAVCVFKMGWH